MKVRIFFALGAIFFMQAVSTPTRTEGRDQAPPQPFSNYVVIGAFAVQKNAIDFTAKAVKGNYPAKYEMNPNRQLYYVYVMMTGDRNEAISEAVRLRKESTYFDTWVYNGILGANAQLHEGRDINPENNQTITPVQKEQATASSQSANTDSQPSIEPATTSESGEVEVANAESSPPADELSKNSDEEISGKPFFFKIYRADSNTELAGDVDLINPDASSKIGSFEGNRMVKITPPNNKSGEITMICEVFGFRKMQRDMDYASPEAEDVYVNEDDATVIPFPLVRLQKGDIAVMYNVYFFKDAGIMRPESRYEVNSLLEMLKENPKYKIRIHGHTNGNAPGKIISPAKGSKDFFSLTGTKEGYGSAKKLSEERADVIRDFLIANGISEKRMEVKAWGGKRPIVDKMATTAQNNVRVEIEILEN